jgi:hypothetical protein
MHLRDSDIPMNVPFTFRNKQPLPLKSKYHCHHKPFSNATLGKLSFICMNGLTCAGPRIAGIADHSLTSAALAPSPLIAPQASDSQGVLCAIWGGYWGAVTEPESERIYTPK